MLVGDERHPVAVTGGPDDQVELLAGAVHEADRGAVEPLDLGSGCQVAVRQVMQDLIVQYRVVGQRRMVRLAEPDPAHVADVDLQEAAEPVLARHRVVGEAVEGHPADELGEEPVAPPGGDHGPVRGYGCGYGYVHRRVARPRPHHHHPSAPELVGRLVGLGVAGLPGERPRVRGDLGQPLEAEAGDHAPVAADLAVRQGDDPRLTVVGCRGHGRLRSQAEVEVTAQSVVGGPGVDDPVEAALGEPIRRGPAFIE